MGGGGRGEGGAIDLPTKRAVGLPREERASRESGGPVGMGDGPGSEGAGARGGGVATGAPSPGWRRGGKTAAVETNDSGAAGGGGETDYWHGAGRQPGRQGPTARGWVAREVGLMLALRGPTARQAGADSPERSGEGGGAEAGSARADNPAGRADSPGVDGEGSRAGTGAVQACNPPTGAGSPRTGGDGENELMLDRRGPTTRPAGADSPSGAGGEEGPVQA